MARQLIPCIPLVWVIGVEALAQQKPDGAAQPLSHWLEQLKQPNMRARMQALQAIGGFGSEAKEAVPPVVELLKDKEVLTRQWAARCLYRIGPAAEAAVPALLEAMKDPVISVRAEVFRALTEVAKAEVAVPALLEALKDKANRPHAASMLGRFGPEARTATHALIDNLFFQTAWADGILNINDVLRPLG